MKNLRKSRVLGLVTLLILALVFVGIDPLEARRGDKPDKLGKPDKPDEGPQYAWQVGIPGEDLAILSGYNLFGYYPQQQNIYSF